MSRSTMMHYNQRLRAGSITMYATNGPTVKIRIVSFRTRNGKLEARQPDGSHIGLTDNLRKPCGWSITYCDSHGREHELQGLA